MNEPRSGWQSLKIGGRPADVFLPERRRDSGGALLYLHDVSAHPLIGDPVFTEAFSRHGFPVVCPHGDSCWWLDQICGDFHRTLTPLQFVREEILPWMRMHWGAEPPTIGLLGVGMGGQGVLQLAYRWPRQFPVVAAISPAVDFHNLWGTGSSLDAMFATREAARQQTATLHVHPLNWPRAQLIVCDPANDRWFESSERLASKLGSTGILFSSDLETSAGGHPWRYAQAMAPRCVQFLADNLLPPL